MAPPKMQIDVTQFPNHYLDVPYANKSPKQTLDIFLPSEGEGPFPTIMFFHGGGWIMGDKRSNITACLYKALSQGYALVGVSYRFATEAKWPAQIHDAKAAVRFIKEHGAEYGLDVDKIGAWGNSAGAHLIYFLAATSGKPGVLEDLSLGCPDQDSTIKTAVVWYGPTDLYNLTVHEKMVGTKARYMGETEEPPKSLYLQMFSNNLYSADSPPCKLVGYAIMEDPENTKESTDAASPIHYVTGKWPPILIQQGLRDEFVPFIQSYEMYKKIQASDPGNIVKLEFIQDAIHGDEAFKTDYNVAHCLEFFDEHLLGQKDRVRPPLGPEVVKVVPVE